jgi:Bacterial regulatory proteins, luxR family
MGPANSRTIFSMAGGKVCVVAIVRVAEELHISMKTVQAYCARIKEKLHLNSATELLREAILWDQRDNATG